MLGLAHDYLLVLRGAERTFVQMAALWPQVPIVTLLYDRAIVEEHFAGHRVVASPLQRLGVGQDGFRRLMPLLRPAAERLPVQGWQLIVSSSSAFAHGLRPCAGAVHVCYCHSPFRYAWHEQDLARAEVPAPLRPVLGRVLRSHRRWDLKVAPRVTHFIANSEITRQRIQSSFGRESSVVHPPVEVDRFTLAEPEDFFVVVGEVTAHKRTGLALAAADRAGVRVKVVGSGPERAALEAAYPAAEFLGRASDGELSSLLARARALIVPNVEEFGIVAVEAQAAGRPVLAAGAGGALETVVPGLTGHFFAPGDVQGLARLLGGDFDGFDPHEIKRHADQFSPRRFQARLLATVQEACAASGRSDLAELASQASGSGL